MEVELTDRTADLIITSCKNLLMIIDQDVTNAIKGSTNDPKVDEELAIAYSKLGEVLKAMKILENNATEHWKLQGSDCNDPSGRNQIKAVRDRVYPIQDRIINNLDYYEVIVKFNDRMEVKKDE